MKISYNWLKQYVTLTTTAEETGKLLTDSGLEVEGIETYETVKGGLAGVVIGQVLTKEQHPNADRLSKTTVTIGSGEPLHIVCGAPNVAAGQKVAVATIGTTLFFADGKELIIKESKIRGELSQGMICAEDELGLGTNHDGIWVLPNDVTVGMPLADYLNFYTDEVLEIGLTPNRIDAASHRGVARDLVAKLNAEGQPTKLLTPDVTGFAAGSVKTIDVIIDAPTLAPRYMGVEVEGITVAPSPEWLQNRLKAIGLRPINNVVDITNYVLHECGQPLHAFDRAKIEGNTVVVKPADAGQTFITLDDKPRTLLGGELMICNANNAICIAGVMGGAASGVTESTTAIFLESAYFEPVQVRKTAKIHGIKTDSSFRFERGADPAMPPYALQRAALLITEICGGRVSSPVIDLYPNPIPNNTVVVSIAQLQSLIGKAIPVETIKTILLGLEISIDAQAGDELTLSVPPFKNDVTRPADIAEEVMRIYGQNNIEIPQTVNATLSYFGNNAKAKLKEEISNRLTGLGFNEVMHNSLTSATYHTLSNLTNPTQNVEMLNPLSNELGVMRQSLLFGALESVARNTSYRSTDLKFYEFGRTYRLVDNQFTETEELSLCITGNLNPEGWAAPQKPTDFFALKAFADRVVQACNLSLSNFSTQPIVADAFATGLVYSIGKTEILCIAEVSPKLLKEFGIKQPVYFANVNWNTLVDAARNNKIKYAELPKYPEVRRDLALLVDTAVAYSDLEKLAIKQGGALLQGINLFDVYEGKNLPEGKKSYALSFVLRDDTKTLTDEEIDGVMATIQKSLEGAGATLRG